MYFEVYHITYNFIYMFELIYFVDLWYLSPDENVFQMLVDINLFWQTCSFDDGENLF